MKKISLIIILTIVALSNICGQTPEQQFNTGNHYYESKNYPEAAKQYEKIIADGYSSIELFYNLGNAYYRTNQIEHAILNYERALRLNPRDHEVRENLDLANSKTIDKINTIPELFIVKFWNNTKASLSTTGWCITSIIILLIACALYTIFYLSYNYTTRKISLGISLVFVILFIISTIFTISSTLKPQEAIIMQTMTTLKSSPEQGSVDKIVLHAGTKVEIEDQIQDWYKVKIADGNKGWIQSSSLEII